MEGALRPRRAGAARLGAAVLAVCLAAGALFAVQAHPEFVPYDQTVDLARPESAVLPGSGVVGPSDLGLLRWQGDAPLRLRLPGLAPPARLRLKLLEECPGEAETGLALALDGRRFAEISLEPRWTLYELAPDAAGEVLTLAGASGATPCPVHLSAVRATTVARQSSDYPRYWVVHGRPGDLPADRGPAPWVAGGLLLATALAWGAATGTGRLGAWLRLVAPGVAALAVAEAAVRAAGLRLAYPPASFPALVLLPGLLLLAWRHRRAILARLAPPTRSAFAAIRPHPVLVLGLSALLLWAWILAGAAESAFGGDLRGLVRFGHRFDAAASFPGAPVSGEWGYDGQFYAVLSTDPLLLRPETLERLDTPTFRANRVLVPLLAWSLSFGQPEAALWAYLALCWLLTLGTVPLVAGWLEERGSSGWWAALLLLNAGMAIALLRVTLDGAALFFLLLALTAHRRERTAAAAVAAAAAALTREVFLVGAVALAAVEVRRGRWRRAAALGAPSVLALGLWRLRVAAVTEPTAKPLSLIFAVPLRWVPRKLSELEAILLPFPDWFWAEVTALAALALAVAAALRLLPRATRDAATLVLVAFAALAAVLSYAIYEVIEGYTRILVALPVLCLAVSGEPDLSRLLRAWLRAVALLAAVSGFFIVRLNL